LGKCVLVDSDHLIELQVIVSSPGSPSSEDSNSYQESVKLNRPAAINSSTSNSVLMNNKPHLHSTNPFLNSLSNGNGNGNGNGSSDHGNGHGRSVSFFTNGTNEQVTPTSSVDTEDGTGHPEEAEHGVEGDAEASDDDHVVNANKH
jgi:hypothetical protein